MLENEEIVNQEEQEINLTSVNLDAIKKISDKKVSLQKNILKVFLSGLILVGTSFGAYQYLNKEQAPALDSTPISEIIDGIEDNSLGTKEVDGVVYDLNQMKQDLGLMYYYAEPLTTIELDQEFIGILNYIEVINRANDELPVEKSYDFYGFSMEKQALISNDLLIAYADKAYNNLWDVQDNHPEYADSINLYLSESDYSKVWDYVDGKITFAELSTTDKEKFVRDWKYNFNFWQQIYKEAGLETNPEILLYIEIDLENEVVYLKTI